MSRGKDGTTSGVRKKIMTEAKTRKVDSRGSGEDPLEGVKGV